MKYIWRISTVSAIIIISQLRQSWQNSSSYPVMKFVAQHGVPLVSQHPRRRQLKRVRLLQSRCRRTHPRKRLRDRRRQLVVDDRFISLLLSEVAGQTGCVTSVHTYTPPRTALPNSVDGWEVVVMATSGALSAHR